jgi:hypothetical protein
MKTNQHDRSPVATNETGRWTAARTYRCIRNSVLCLTLLSPLPLMAGEFTQTSPQGALFDVRTHYYDQRKERVIKRPQFEGLHGEAEREAYAKVNIQLGPRNPERSRRAREAWNREIDSRRALRVSIAKEKAAQRRGFLPEKNFDYFSVVRLPDGTTMVFMRTPTGTSSTLLENITPLTFRR